MPPKLQVQVLRIGAFALVLVFWAMCVPHLDRLPHLNFDEEWILSPGLKFFNQGIFGSDMFRGLDGMERNYFEFMPLLSLLQGAGAQVWGIGIWQLRFVTVALGLVTLALTFRAGTLFFNSTVGGVAMLLLMFWQWTPGANPNLSSGLALLDISRLARYDILVAPLGLGGLCVWGIARKSHSAYYPLAGILAGSAGLAHPHGLVWVVGLGILILLDGRQKSLLQRGAFLAKFSVGVLAPWALYGIWVGLNWSDFAAQARFRAGALDLFSPQFYLTNLRNEPARYMLGMSVRAFLTQVGGWLALVGIPLSLIGLTLVGFARHRFEMFAFVIPGVVFPVLLALAFSEKRFYYLISPILIWSLVVAEWIVLVARQRRVLAFLAVGLVLLVVLEASMRVIAFHTEAAALPSEQTFMREVAQAVRNGKRIIGPTEYFLAAPNSSYRSDLLPIYLSYPSLTQPPLTFDAALEQIQPDIVIGYPVTYDAPGQSAMEADLESFLVRHHARVIAQLETYDAQHMLIYQLADPASP